MFYSAVGLLEFKTGGGGVLVGVRWCYLITIRTRTFYGDWDNFFNGNIFWFFLVRFKTFFNFSLTRVGCSDSKNDVV